MGDAAADPFAIFELYRKPERETVSVEDAESRWLRASVIRRRMGGNPTYKEMEDYAVVCFTPHTCEPRCWTSMQRKQVFNDPKTARLHTATGNVFLCWVSGRTHVCDGTDCYAYVKLEPSGEQVCTVSCRNMGPAIVVASSTASRKQIKDANAATVAPSAPAKRPPPTGVEKPAKRVANKNTGKRFSQGSVAEEMQRTFPDERIQYGGKLIEYAIRQISEDSRRAAGGWCEFLTCAAPRTTWKAAQNAAYLRADALAQRYSNLVVSQGRIDPMSFRCQIFSIFEAHFADQVQRAEWLAFGGRNNGRAISYFSNAMLVLWKLAECTPACCESQPFPGGPTRKKQRARSHLRNVACALIYLLEKGYSEKVRYDTKSRRLLSDTEASKIDPALVATERIVFIPAHDYLKACLPSPQHLNSSNISFEGVICSGTSSIRTASGASERQAAAGFDPDLMSNMGWATESLRSLTNVRPALTIETIREYQLKNFIGFHDTCPTTGEFVPLEG